MPPAACGLPILDVTCGSVVDLLLLEAASGDLAEFYELLTGFRTLSNGDVEDRRSLSHYDAGIAIFLETELLLVSSAPETHTDSNLPRSRFEPHLWQFEPRLYRRQNSTFLAPPSKRHETLFASWRVASRNRETETPIQVKSAGLRAEHIALAEAGAIVCPQDNSKLFIFRKKRKTSRIVIAACSISVSPQITVSLRPRRAKNGRNELAEMFRTGTTGLMCLARRRVARA